MLQHYKIAAYVNSSTSLFHLPGQTLAQCRNFVRRCYSIIRQHKNINLTYPYKKLLISIKIMASEKGVQRVMCIY